MLLHQQLLALAKKRNRAIGVVAGSGECARAAVQAGADLLIALSAGVFRTLGRPSLAACMPFGNANAQTEALLREHLLPHTGTCPVID